MMAWTQRYMYRIFQPIQSEAITPDVAVAKRTALSSSAPLQLNHGSEKARYGKVFLNVAQFMTHRPPPRLLAALQTSSHVLLRLAKDFHFQLPDYQVYSFGE